MSDDPLVDVEMERALVGTLIAFPDLLATTCEGIEAQFADPAHAAIVEAVRALFAAGRAVDGLSLPAELKRRQRFNAVGGAGYLGDLIEMVHAPSHVPTWTAHLIDLAQRRRLRDLASRVRGLALDRETHRDAEVAIAAALASVQALAEAAPTASDDVPDIAAGVDEVLEHLIAEQVRPPLTSGLTALDARLYGFMPGRLYVLAGGTGAGKSAFALRLAERAARAGMGALYVTMELPKREIVARLACGDVGVPPAALEAKAMNPWQTQQVFESLRGLYGLPLWIKDGPSSIESVRGAVARSAARAKREGRPLGVVVVDYLQLMQLARRRDDSEAAALGAVTRALKALALQFNVPVVLLSQFNRDAAKHKREEQTHDLKGSSSIEQDADVVLLMRGADPAAPRPTIQIALGKVRNAAPGEPVSVIFDKAHGRFLDANIADLPETSAGVSVRDFDPDEPESGEYATPDYDDGRVLTLTHVGGAGRYVPSAGGDAE